jgi:hypothetical protein
MAASLGYYLPVVAREVELGRIATREDMDIALQLLRKGYPNAVWHGAVTDPRSYTPGGCSSWRTIESTNKDARTLAQLHKGYVTVVERQYKSVPRLEVICGWGKALRDGQLARPEASISAIL